MLAGVSGRSRLSAPRGIGDRIGDADGRGHAVAFAHTLGAERRYRAQGVAVEDERIGHLARGRHQVVGERAGEEAPVLGIGELLVERRAHGVGEGAADLAVNQRRIEAAAGIVGGDVAVDGDGAGEAVDLDATEIEDEAVSGRAVDPVVIVRRREFRRRSSARSRVAPAARRRAGCPATSGGAMRPAGSRDRSRGCLRRRCDRSRSGPLPPHN